MTWTRVAIDQVFCVHVLYVFVTLAFPALDHLDAGHGSWPDGPVEGDLRHIIISTAQSLQGRYWSIWHLTHVKYVKSKSINPIFLGRT
ncbi:hypothetical protein HBI04_176860 [Parastagonospora nodorum]|nr:hypothetical protein HBI04_176860 [Parastagonospora nodorum]KAH4864136.1 hypothetical protein HBH75_002570 [Parastagonospora nodorum]